MITTTRLVKSEDLNHHQTLFAGRAAEWFVETAFMAACENLNPKNVVCKKIHGMTFNKPANAGDILIFESYVVHAGTTSLTSYVVVRKDLDEYVRGFVTFVHVDEDGKPLSHGWIVKPHNEETSKLYNEVLKLLGK